MLGFLVISFLLLKRFAASLHWFGCQQCVSGNEIVKYFLAHCKYDICNKSRDVFTWFASEALVMHCNGTTTRLRVQGLVHSICVERSEKGSPATAL